MSTRPHRELLIRFGYRSVAEFIRDRLLRGPTNPYRIYEEYLRFLRAAGVSSEVMPSFSSFWRVHIYMLKRLGLIVPVRRERGPSGRPVTVYGVPARMRDSPLWRMNVQRVASERFGWRPRHLGRRRYRRRVLGLPPLPRGRPRRGVE